MRPIFEEARKIIRINSVSSNGNEELANYVSTLLQDHGLKPQLQQVTHSLENVSKRQFNVIGILGDPLVDKKTKKGLLLTTNLDTVSPGLPENWTETGGDPFAANFKDGKIFGLGSADTKLDFLCKLHAIEKFREKKLKMPIYLVGTCGEELGMFGAKYLIKSLALNPKYVLVGEPSGLKLIQAHKCMALFRVSIDYQLIERDARGFNRKIDLHSFGKSAHGSSPDLGTNAILQAVDFLKHAADSGFELRFTQLGGGDTKNKVPDSSRIEFYLTSHQFEDFKRFFRETVKMLSKEKAFRADLGGLGDMGVRFLPDALFPCVLEMVNFFRDLSGELEGKSNPSFDPPGSTVNFSMVKQRPSGVDLYFDLRLLPQESPEEIEKRILKGIQSVAARYSSLNILSVKERLNPGLNTSPDSAFIKLCTEAMTTAGMDVALAKTSTSTEAALFSQAGYESIAFGPGTSTGNSHSPNEFNLSEDIEKATLFYQKVIERVCL